MATIGIIQGRMASTRLPGKLLAPLAGQPLLAVLFERIRRAAVDEWWLATSDEPIDDISEAWAGQLGMRVFRGDKDDVLSRFTAILRLKDPLPRWIVRITADDPFVDKAVVDLLLLQASRMDPRQSVISERVGARKLPLGYVPQVVRADRLFTIESEIPVEQSYHHSHVLSWLYDQGEAAEFAPPTEWTPRPDWRWTVDTPLDLEMAQQCFALFGDNWSTVGYPEMERLLSTHPELTRINAEVAQKTLGEG